MPARGVRKHGLKFQINVRENGRRRTRMYATETEAQIGLLVWNATRNVLHRARKEELKARPLEEKRAADLAISGNTSQQEREVAHRMVREWIAVTEARHEAQVWSGGPWRHEGGQEARDGGDHAQDRLREDAEDAEDARHRRRREGEGRDDPPPAFRAADDLPRGMPQLLSTRPEVALPHRLHRHAEGAGNGRVREVREGVPPAHRGRLRAPLTPRETKTTREVRGGEGTSRVRSSACRQALRLRSCAQFS